MFNKKISSSLVSLCLLGLATPLMAAENGELDMPLGVWGLDSAILPLSGFYAQMIGERYDANSVKDVFGNDVKFATLLPVAPGESIPVTGTVSPRITVNAVTPKFVYIADQPILGGASVGAYLAIPLIEKTHNVSVQVDTPLPPPLPGEIGTAASQAETGTKRGVGDVEFTPFLGWKLENISIVTAVSIDLPTGSFNKADPVNLGVHYYSVRPLASLAYSTESGFDLAAALSYNFSTVNHDTNYKSGQYAAVEYLASYQFSDNIKAGLQGYSLDQTTNDQDPDGTALVPIVNGNKARTNSIGPTFSYQSDDLKNKIEFKYLAEYHVRARSQGDLLMLTLSHLF